MSHELDIDRIRRAAQRLRVGSRLEYLEEAASTNDTAWHLLSGATDTSEWDGLVILAEHQTAGRGRLGRDWKSPRGASLLCSIIIVESAERSCGESLMLLSAVAARDAVASCTELNPQIKWPNDLVIGGRKLAGVLIESKRFAGGHVASVCGVGINCLQQRGHFDPALAASATSLELESAFPVDRTDLAIALLAEFGRRLDEVARVGGDALRLAWLAHCEPMGQPIRLRSGGRVYSGTTIDIDPTAALVVQLDSGVRRAFSAQDTTVARDEESSR